MSECMWAAEKPPDALATRHEHSFAELCSDRDFSNYRVFFDGSCAAHGSGGGRVLYGARQVMCDSLEEWTKIAELSFPLESGSTVTAAELEACLWGAAYLLARLQGPEQVACHLKSWRPLDTKRVKILSLSGLIPES